MKKEVQGDIVALLPFLFVDTCSQTAPSST